MSQLIGAMHPDDMTADELARVHDAVDAAQDLESEIDRPAVLRIAGFLLATAASILIISSAWLLEVPPSSAPRIGLGPTVPAWQYAAVDPRETAPPLIDERGETRLADAGDGGLADWIVHELNHP